VPTAKKMKPPPQGRLPFEYEVDETEDDVTSYGGLPLIIDVLRSQNVDEAIRQHVHVRERACQFDEVALIEAMVLLLAAGGDCLDDIRMLSADTALCRLLERKMPSPETLRLFLYEFHDDALLERAAIEAKEAGEDSFIPAENDALSGLGRVLCEHVRAVAARRNPTAATIDADATLVESHKREAKAHYKDGRGYQPMLATWAEEDLIVADQFRDGNVPSHKAALDFVQRAFAAVPDAVKQRRFRGDSAFFVWELMIWLFRQRIGFTVSARMSEQLKEACLAVSAKKWTLLESRAHEDVYIAEVSHIPTDWPKDLATVRFIGIRFDPKQRNIFDERTTKYLAIATDRTAPAAELVKWHWEKAGTIEHVNDVVKNELGAGVLPCGRFGANAAWWRLNALTYNVLSALKSIGLPPELKDARPKRLRFTVFTIPATLASHARQLWARLKSRAGQAMAAVVLPRRRLWLPATATASSRRSSSRPGTGGARAPPSFTQMQH
jgi:hypothetical protein